VPDFSKSPADFFRQTVPDSSTFFQNEIATAFATWQGRLQIQIHSLRSQLAGGV
jgi:hypothetical protein